MKGKTHQEILNEISNKNTASEADENIIKYWALKLGFKNVVVTSGIIYPDGMGQAFSVNQFAKELLKAFENSKLKNEV